MSESPPPPSASSPASPDQRLRTMVEMFGQDWVNDFNDPIVFRSYSLSSRAAKQFYARDFTETSRFLFAEILYRRRPDFDVALLDSFVVEVAKKLSDVHAKLAVRCEQLHKLCESNGQPEDAAYVHPQLLLVPIIAAHATSYMRCLVRLDELYRLSGSATLNGVIDGNQRKFIELQARKLMRSLNGLIRNEYNRLRAESERLRTRAEVPDPEPERVEDDQAQVVNDPDQAVQDEEGGESGRTGDPTAPLPAEVDIQLAHPDNGAMVATLPTLEPAAAEPDAAIAS